MAYNVAQAEVTVLPNAENFGERLKAQIGAQADVVGRQVGEQIGEQIREKVRKGLGEGLDVPVGKPTEQGARAGGAFGDAFRNRLKAALATLPDIKLDADASSAQNRLAGIRTQLAELSDKRIGVDIDATAALARLELLRERLGKLTTDADIRIRVDSRAASLELDKFAAEMKAKAELAGATTGETLGKNVEKSADGRGRGKLIAAAIGLGLAAGGPLIVAAAGAALGGVAAVVLRNQEDVENAWNGMARDVRSAYKGVANEAIPELTQAINKIRNAAIESAPAIKELFGSLGPAIQGVTDGVLGLVQNALPGLTSMLQNSAPIFNGLRTFMESLGTGLGNLFAILGQNAPVLGDALRAIGDVIAAIMPVLGELVVAAANLARTVLPPLASALGLVANVLHAIQPILGPVVLGFLAFKAVGSLSGPIGSLGTALGKLAERNLPGISSAAGKASGALSKIGGALPGIGLALGLLGAGWEMNEQQINGWKDALLAGGAAARQATSEMAELDAAVKDNTTGTKGFVNDLFGIGNAFRAVGGNSQDAKDKLNEYLDTLPPAQREQALATQAQNDLADALARHDTDDAADAMKRYESHTAEAARQQAILDAAINGTTPAIEMNRQRLQEVSNAAGMASSNIGLYKLALDQLKGAQVDVNAATAALTQATTSAIDQIKGMDGALVGANGQLDLTKPRGAAAYSALQTVASGSNQVIAAMIQQGATSEQVEAKDAELRSSFINTATQMGFSAAEANRLADEILGIPDHRKTEITADTAQADAAAASFKKQWESIQSRKITLTVENNIITSKTFGSLQNGVTMQAAGGINVKRFDGGGFNMRPNMSASVAQVVSPNTWRVIGDRTADDEAFIPINNSARSLSILAQTAERMGFGLSKAGARSGSTDARTYHFAISAPNDPRAIAREIREAQRDLEFLHG